MSFSDFQKYLNHNYGELKINFQQHILGQIKQIMTDTIRATYSKLDPRKIGSCFEVLGYDFMIDEDFKLYLIEVNTNPCLETDSPLLSRIIPELIHATFKLVLDPIFPCPDHAISKKYQVNQLPQEIRYKLIFDDKHDCGSATEQMDTDVSAEETQREENDTVDQSHQQLGEPITIIDNEQK